MHYSNIPSGLLGASGIVYNMQFTGQLYIEVSIVMGSETVNLDGLHDIKELPPLQNIIQINPNYSSNYLQDIILVFHDPDRYFFPLKTVADENGYFQQTHLILGGVPTVTQAESQAIYANNEGRYFNSNNKIVFVSNSDLEEVYITASTEGANKNIVTYPNGALSGSYASGDLMASEPLQGKQVIINLRPFNTNTTYQMYEGRIRHPFKWSPLGEAELSLDNELNTVFDKQMKIHASSSSPTQIMDTSGSLTSSLSWSSGATGTCSGVTVYEGAFLGEWKVTFSDATNFTVTGPNCDAKAGTTGSDFYDQTDATDSQIKIASAAWGGPPSASDELTFKVCANFESKTLVEILYEILHNYGGIEATEFDYAGTGITDLTNANYYGQDEDSRTWNQAYSLQSSTPTQFSISIYDSITIGSVLDIVLPHDLIYVHPGDDGRIMVTMLNYFFFNRYMDTDYAISPANKYFMTNIEPQDYEMINEFTVLYAYDYDNEKYLKSYTYPETDADNLSLSIHGKKVSKTIKAPGCYSETAAQKLAKKYYSVWFMGIHGYNITGTMRYLGVEPGQLIQGEDYLEDMELLVIGTEKRFLDKNRIKMFTIPAIKGAGISGIWS